MSSELVWQSLLYCAVASISDDAASGNTSVDHPQCGTATPWERPQ
ncbi:hypothetical protein [Stieleria varia]|nr:hypothetical protein [Stieleria varia]